MKSFNITKFLFGKILILLLLTGLTSSVQAQDLVLGADFVNRYIWRGFDLGNEVPCIQPNVAIVAGGFTAGFWGAYSFSTEHDPATGAPRPLDEIDLYASYAFALGEEAGGLSLGFTDYMNPNSGVPFSNFNNFDDSSVDGPGAHFIEINAAYSGPTSFPLSVAFNVFVHNVEDNPIYWQLGYNTAVKDIGLSLFIGGTVDSSAYYGTGGFDVINTGITISKTIPITDSFSLPIYGSVILNPAADHMFYVVGIKL